MRAGLAANLDLVMGVLPTHCRLPTPSVGLRTGEVVRLRVGDIDSAQNISSGQPLSAARPAAEVRDRRPDHS